ncbi:avidin-like [Diadema antillarum]|uniref:avidin-like n=1 Tax=Diadema antillarum TaxID=105358 RepID=UPI003A8BC020
MNRIMLNWTLLLVGLVFGSSGFVTTPRNSEDNHHPHHHRHHGHRGGQDVGVAFQETVVYQIPEDNGQVEGVATCNVSGTWYNGHGSEMIIEIEPSGHVTGEFRTAVERKLGAAGTIPGRITGWTSADRSRKTVSFSVLWNGGTSVTAWTGLCHVCNGVEVMKTTWILTSDVDSCGDHWSSNRIGQDDFTRMEQAPGPRRHLGIHTPSDFAAQARPRTQQPDEGVLSQLRQDN